MNCFLIQEPKVNIAVVYCCPVESVGPQYPGYASEFAASMAEHEPGYPYQLVVVSNGGPPSEAIKTVFEPFNPLYLIHDNRGYDLGAYQLAAQQVPCDLMVFCGSSAYVRGPGWMRRIAESFLKHGYALYGTMVNTGDPATDVHPHIRTTCFWCPPELFNLYPVKVLTPYQRYPFEHGYDNLTMYLQKLGLATLMVAWDREYDFPEWRSIPNGFHAGDQSGLILGDRISRPPYWHTK